MMFPVEWAQKILLFVIGLCSGALVAAGMFAFVTMIGVVSRMAASTKTICHAMRYEDCVVVGATVGNIFPLCAGVPYRLGGQRSAGGLWLFCRRLYRLSFDCAGRASECRADSVAPAEAAPGLTAFVLSFAAGKLLGAAVDLFL